MGIPARSKHEAGKDAHPTRKFWVFFYLEVPKFQGIVGPTTARTDCLYDDTTKV